MTDAPAKKTRKARAPKTMTPLALAELVAKDTAGWPITDVELFDGVLKLMRAREEA